MTLKDLKQGNVFKFSGSRFKSKIHSISENRITVKNLDKGGFTDYEGRYFDREVELILID